MVASLTPCRESRPHRLLTRSMLLLLTLGLSPWTLNGQVLSLKRDVPTPDRSACPAPSAGASSESTPESRDEAVRLGSEASQALVLGDRERARDLLSRATGLDPRSPGLAYQYGRVLEELGASGAATEAFCRSVALAPDGDEAEAARARLEVLAARERPAVPPEAVDAFQDGLGYADAGDLHSAADAFGRATQAAPEWPEAWFDRGVVRARLDQRPAAIDDLRRYLVLRPDAHDAQAVAELIGQLSTPAAGPSAGAAFTLGLLIPGMGQFYAGRPRMGLVVLTVAAGAAAAALLVEEVTVRCLADIDPGGDCPPGQVLEEETRRPYLVAGLAGAGAVTLLGAVEAALRASGRSPEIALGTGNAALRVGLAPAVEAGTAGSLRLRVLRLHF